MPMNLKGPGYKPYTLSHSNSRMESLVSTDIVMLDGANARTR